MDHNFSYVDLFAGCGGLSLGLHNSGWKGLFAIEKSPAAFKTLKYNLIDASEHFSWVSWLAQTHLDIDWVIRNRRQNLMQLRGKVDLVAGGPPCQGFSVAGRRQENDVRNGLVRSYIKFIKLVQPRLLFFENVKGFTLEFKRNKEKGKVYSNFVEKELIKSGYFVYGKLINFADYGLPQKRTRFILVGVRRDFAGSNPDIASSFFDLLLRSRTPFLKKKGLKENQTLEDAISDLLKANGVEPCHDNRAFNVGTYAAPSSAYQRLMRIGNTRRLPDSHRFANHSKVVEERFQKILDESATRRNRKLDKLARESYRIKKHTIVPLDPKDHCPTLTTLPDDCIHYCEPRILTVREYARIQGFPDSFEFQDKYTTGGIERKFEVPRYTQAGNAIPPLFAEQCGNVLKLILETHG